MRLHQQPKQPAEKRTDIEAQSPDIVYLAIAGENGKSKVCASKKHYAKQTECCMCGSDPLRYLNAKRTDFSNNHRNKQ